MQHWADEELIVEGDVWLQTLERAIASARRRISIEMYIFATDETGSRILEALLQAGARGVQVQMVIDGAGSSGLIWERLISLHQSPLAVRVFHPLPTQVLSPVFGHGAGLFGFLRMVTVLNRRNHRKVVIIDDAYAFVGSFNLCNTISQQASGSDYWREAGARVEGPAVASLVTAFEHSWAHAWHFEPRGLRRRRLWPRRLQAGPPAGLVRLNHRLRARLSLWRDLIRRIQRAQGRVWIAAAYFVPPRRLLRALTRAAQRGCDVRILMSRRSDVSFMPWVAATFWKSLVPKGVQVHLFEPGIIHAKVTLIDTWLCVGSSNLNMRSLLHDLEADVVLTRRESVALMEKTFGEGFAQSNQVCDSEKCGNFFQQWVVALALLMRRFI